MRKIFVCIIYLISTCTLNAQRIDFGIMGGMAAYSGDLSEKGFTKRFTKPAIGVTANYELTDKITLRSGLMATKVGGADRYSKKPNNRFRNLSFESNIIELSAVGEYYLFNLNRKNISPYVFGGLAVFHFNPYTFNSDGNKVYLHDMSTEGQGIRGYNRKLYHLMQVAIPIGGGLKFNLGNNIRVGLETGVRKLFTDYLDDVSKTYIDANDLQAAKGINAVDISFRSDEIEESVNYPAKGMVRGNAKVKDYYYFAGIHLTYRLGWEWKCPTH